ncbi:hypothetical protein CPB97_005073, partial [Podila verticillata]
MKRPSKFDEIMPSPKKARLSGKFHPPTSAPTLACKRKSSVRAMKPKALWMNPVVRPRPLPCSLWALAEDYVFMCIIQMHIASGALVMGKAGISPNQPLPYPVVTAATRLHPGHKHTTTHVRSRHPAIHSAPASTPVMKRKRLHCSGRVSKSAKKMRKLPWSPLKIRAAKAEAQEQLLARQNQMGEDIEMPSAPTSPVPASRQLASATPQQSNNVPTHTLLT